MNGKKVRPMETQCGKWSRVKENNWSGTKILGDKDAVKADNPESL